MNWFDRKLRKRKSIIDDLKAKIALTSLSDISCFQSDIFKSEQNNFNISPNVKFENVEITLPTHFKEHVQFEIPDIYTEQLSIEPYQLRKVPRFEEIVKIHIISLNDFKFSTQRFDFGPERQEPKSLFHGVKQPLGIGGIKVKPVEPPARPSKLDKQSLEERLKWLLTPPIHEILSDPQLSLPEKPFTFQTFGIKWLYDRENALLADEMGLGKTMQAIIAARLLWKQGIIKQVLIICPKTLISNWKKEFCKWWPQVTQNIHIAGTDRQFFLKLGTPNVIVKIINYESLSRELDWLKDQKFDHDLIIIDEAQRIKSPSAKTSQAVKALKAKRRWALTGTPLENKIDDVISIFKFVEPNLVDYTDSEEFICKQIRPYILRRRTDEVDIELPEKFEQDVEITLDSEHHNVYTKMENEGVVELNEMGDQITAQHVFALINKLRQFCNFCPISGASAKLERLLEDMEEIKESSRKALIFSQFVKEDYGIKRLAKELDINGFKNLQLFGETSNRIGDIEKQFNTDKNISSLLLQFKVGGVGLNLQAANYVYLFDRWWNPAVEDQLPKRAHRIGQTQKVFVRKFYCKDTIEERILVILSKKREDFKRIIDENRPAESMGLTEEEIFSLFNLKVRPRKQTHQIHDGQPVEWNLENTSPSQFENLVAEIYEKQGYKVTITGGSHDEGIDIVAEKYVGNAHEKVIVQCKHQQANVGRPVLQQFWGVITSDHSTTRGDFVTSASFSGEAKDFAKEKRLTLIDRNELIRLAKEYKVAMLK
ncbi:MAG: restriction endonuclease [Sedimentisphaerales bacterium]|nr:restriction endonuclease [Sedimentisphaerales bacterium]